MTRSPNGMAAKRVLACVRKQAEHHGLLSSSKKRSGRGPSVCSWLHHETQSQKGKAQAVR